MPTKPYLPDLLAQLRTDHKFVKAYLNQAAKDSDPAVLALAIKNVKDSGFMEWVMGARKRDLAARYLLINQGEIPKASPEDRAAFKDYVRKKGWKSLYGHDRAMYRLLRKRAEAYCKNRAMTDVTRFTQTVSRRLSSKVSVVDSASIVRLVVEKRHPSAADWAALEELNDEASELPIDCLVRFSRAAKEGAE